jgi:hypothetical protein
MGAGLRAAPACCSFWLCASLAPLGGARAKMPTTLAFVLGATVGLVAAMTGVRIGED